MLCIWDWNVPFRNIKTVFADECNVVKIGNYPTSKVETSRIITYGKHTDEELAKVKELTEIKKVEDSDEMVNVKFTIIIGANY